VERRPDRRHEEEAAEDEAIERSRSLRIDASFITVVKRRRWRVALRSEWLPQRTSKTKSGR